MVKPLWRTVPIFLEKLKTELPYDTVIPPLGIHSEKTIIPKDTHTSVFTEALFTIVPEYGSNLNFHQQMGVKQNVVDTYNGILFSPKKERNPVM